MFLKGTSDHGTGTEQLVSGYRSQSSEIRANIFLAKEGDFQKATQRVYRLGQQAWYIALPLVEPAR